METMPVILKLVTENELIKKVMRRSVSTMGLLLLSVAFGDQFECSMYNKQGS